MDDNAIAKFGSHAKVTVFRSRLDESTRAEYEPVAERAESLARSMPGFIDFKTFVADDGERLSLVVFDSPEHQQAWRDDEFHRQAQRLGREQFYEEYEILICDLVEVRSHAKNERG